MSAATFVAFLVTSTLVRPYGYAQDVELAPTAVVPAPRGAAPSTVVTAADAERLGRMLDALAGYETDQRTIAAIFSLAAGAGVAASGIVLASDSSVPDSNRMGPILIGVGAGVAMSGVLTLFVSGTAQDLAEAFARDAAGSPGARLEATRVAEAGLIELRDNNETGRYVVGSLLMLLGAGTGVLGGALLATSESDSLRTTSTITLGSGAGLAASGLYLLAFGKTPVERFIDGYTMVTIGQTSDGGTTVGLGGSF